MASKRKTKVQDILFRSRIRKTTVQDVNGPQDTSSSPLPPKASLPKESIGLPKSDPHADLPLTAKSSPKKFQLPTASDLEDMSDDIFGQEPIRYDPRMEYDYYDDIIEDGVDFRPDDIMLMRIANGEYDPDEGMLCGIF